MQGLVKSWGHFLQVKRQDATWRRVVYVDIVLLDTHICMHLYMESCTYINTHTYTHIDKMHVLLLSRGLFPVWIICPCMNENMVFSVATLLL